MSEAITNIQYAVARAKSRELRIARVIAITTIVVPTLATMAALSLVLAGIAVPSAFDIALMFFLYIATELGVTVGFHRLFTHHSFKANRIVEIVLGILGSMAAQGPLLFWVAEHRQHHRRSDMAGDPHSPNAPLSRLAGEGAGERAGGACDVTTTTLYPTPTHEPRCVGWADDRKPNINGGKALGFLSSAQPTKFRFKDTTRSDNGRLWSLPRWGRSAQLTRFWHAHVSWMVGHNATAWRTQAFDLLRNRAAVTISQWYVLWVVIGLILPGIVSGLWHQSLVGFINGILWGGFVRIFLVHHATWSVNSIGHLVGRRRFETRDHSRNNWFVALITLGEGWHNNHHAFPFSARHGFTWWEFDPSYLFIRLLAMIGLAHDVKTPHARHIIRRQSSQNLKDDAGGGSNG